MSLDVASKIIHCATHRKEQSGTVGTNRLKLSLSCGFKRCVRESAGPEGIPSHSLALLKHA